MRQIITLFFILSFIQLNAQTEKNYILSTSLGYHFTHNDPLDSETNTWGQQNYGEKNKEFNAQFSAGRKLKKNFYYGLGLSYKKSSYEINPDSDIPEINRSSGFVTITGYTNSISTDLMISPSIYIQYFTSFSERASILVDLYSRYDFNRTKTKNTFYSPDIENYTYINSGEYKAELEKQNINFGIQPALRLDIVKNFGLEFKFGVIEYQHKTYDSRRNDIDKKTNSFRIGFKPENWLIGLYFKL